jgi:16S rRNA (uracil1498-N3)-methyltransferase
VPDESGWPPVFIAERSSLERDTVLLDGAEGRHAATVRRLRPGERVDLTDGAGLMVSCVVSAARPGLLELTVVARRLWPPPQPRICVVQALPKGDRGELAVETMTEVGVDVIVPWSAQRCVAVWPGAGAGAGASSGRGTGGKTQARGDKALARWRAAAVAAAKQARRAHIPEVTPLAGTGDVVALLGAAAFGAVLNPDAELRLSDLPLPVAGNAAGDATGDIVLIVGPEGGLSPAESAAFAAAGATAARLGPTVLRSSTAGTAAAAVLLSRCGRW